MNKSVGILKQRGSAGECELGQDGKVKSIFSIRWWQMLQSFVKYEWTVENEIGMETNIWEDTATLRAFEVLNKYEYNNSV